jgi:hypothetical protein
VAILYELDTAEFRYVLDTFPLVPEHERRTALEAFGGAGGPDVRR